MRFSSYLLLGCLSLASLPGLAQTVNDLYQVREPVTSQSPQERDRATQAAVQTMVVRLTGNTRAAEGAALAEVRKDPQQIISQYGYEPGPPQTLLVDFDPASTDRALRQAGLPIWGSNRPSILGWWLIDSTEGSNLVGDAQEAAAPLRRAAQHRGLPMQLPLADLSEQGVGTAQHLSASDPGELKQASERYGADAILAVHAREEGGKWQAQWRLWLGEQREQGNVGGDSVEALADAVLLAVTERLAPRFAVKPGATASTLQFEVQGMNLERYAQLMRVLEAMGGKLVLVEGERSTFAVGTSAEQLRNQLGLARLQEIPASEAVPVDASAPATAPTPGAEAGAPVSAGKLYFRW
ncbi:DUF2066 domain-containing protein [Pseudomonas sp. 21LCFQ02]|uniref:DUF2066 domain-containing protein n=1 Tax=unclassified Pseudomonas TaxID=196821 RepID=UPI0004F7149E|nr:MULTISPECIES: DUF2066 domain-containing protein [unclassified Pseudomonas]MCO8163042.1 DUF2066 domain-containing protein [Pseudomonas sp. 21LCFQ010]MCO8168391.1 DUF2066 domain-containing protein [Pseudomonas sp. 21LCFQ02]BAP41091.1 hypothetical protein PSCI_0389 [Pseudomonas sp. StFLB209]